VDVVENMENKDKNFYFYFTANLLIYKIKAIKKGAFASSLFMQIFFATSAKAVSSGGINL